MGSINNTLAVSSFPQAPSVAWEVALLENLCQIYSPTGNEEEVAKYLVSIMESLGWNAQRDEVGNAVGHVGQGDYHLVFLGHIDTVPGYIPLTWEGDTLVGRGTVDAKGPLAAFIAAVARLKNIDNIRITVIGAVGEEGGDSVGAYHIVDKYRPDLCIVGEPSGWAGLTLGYKGCLGVTVKLTQAENHSAGQGTSAPEEAVRFWNGVQAVCRALSPGEGAFYSLTPTLKEINSGGDGFRQWATLKIGLRIPLGCNKEQVVKALEGIAPDAEVELSGHQPAFKAGKANPLVAAFLTAIRSQGGRPSFKVKTGTADMNVVGPVWDCPILAYGPGDSNLDHTPWERVSLGEYRQAIAVLTKVLEQLKKRAPVGAT